MDNNNNRNGNPLDHLYDIVNDLWGVPIQSYDKKIKENLEAAKALDYETDPMAAFKRTLEEAKAAAKPAEDAAPAEAKQTFPPFEQFWKIADETVDWTEALAHETAADGLTSPDMWSFFHQHAARVLEGDLEAYVEVMQAANPLGNLLPYASNFNVKADNADHITVIFDAMPSYLDQSESERRRYLAGICLRTARDLMALLPVCDVDVTAQHEGKPLLTVPFARSELQKVRFSFVDPVAFVISCGGTFTEA